MPSSKTTFPWSTILWAVGIFALVLVLWLNLPILMQAPASGVTPPTPTSEPRQNSPFPTSTQAETRTPEPSATAMPESDYFVADPGVLDPPLPGLQHGLYIIQEDEAQVSPDFSDLQWISSDQVGAQLGFEIPETYYATFGPGQITWSMDSSLPPGLYEIFIMDTVYSSAGSLEFQVLQDGVDLNPMYGSRRIDFNSSRGENPQDFDQWRSIGMYEIQGTGILSVSTAWQTRDEETIVAVDRVAIVPLSEASRQLVQPLPKDRTVLFVDDRAARIQTSQVIFPETNGLAWEGGYQFVINPSVELKASWSPNEPLPPGQWEIAVWIPAEHASGPVTYRLKVEDQWLDNDQSGSDVAVNFADLSGGRWISLGTWTTPPQYEKVVELTLEMTAAAGASGEIPLDVVAFLKVP